MPPAQQDYKGIFTQLIQKQILILGPDITIAKVKGVAGIEVDPQGNVTNITGDPQTVLQNLINQFVELSGLIVKKTMESILTSQIADLTKAAAPVAPSVLAPAQPVQPPVQTPDQAPQPPVQEQAPAQPSGGVTPAPNENIDELNKMISDMNATIAEAQKQGV